MNRPSLRGRILAEVRKHRRENSTALARRFGISRQAVHRHLRRLIRERRIVPQGTSRKTTFYVLNNPRALRAAWKERRSFRKRYPRVGLEEERVFREVETHPTLLSSLPPEIRILFHYGFTEMLNNAIEHSESPQVDVLVEATPQAISFQIADRGIGTFESIRSKKKLGSELEAIQDLLKGKQTTSPEAHSGEGIFFTSRAVDRFILLSHKKRLIVDNRLDDLFIEDAHFWRGTKVIGEIERRSQRRLEEIFRLYSREPYAFDKSEVRVALFREGSEPISRSQAKRLLHTLDRFKEIVLDFRGVTTVGQGFADEVFRVFQDRHSDITLTPVNCNENIRFMIDRARSFTGLN